MHTALHDLWKVLEMKRVRIVWTVSLIVTIAFVLTPNIHYGSCLTPPPIEWENTFGSAGYEHAYSLVQTTDKGYAVAGITYPSQHGGETQVLLVKTDAYGSMQWNRTYGGEKTDEWCSSIVQTADGGYALAGWTNKTVDGNRDFWLVKTDSLGNMQWNRTFGSSAYWEQASCLVQAVDGGLAVVGGVTPARPPYGYSSAWLVKTDVNGNMEWNRTYGGTYDISQAFSIVRTLDGGYALGGVRTHSFWLIKTNSTGHISWEWTSSSGGAWYAVGMQTSDLGYAVAGCAEGGISELQYVLWKIDRYGWTVEWGGIYGKTDMKEYMWSAVQTYDGGFALAGYRQASSTWVVKTDSKGKMQWDQTYSGYARSIVQTADAGLAFAGEIVDSYGKSDFYLVKLGGDHTPPSIGAPIRNPEYPQAHQNVTIFANVTDMESGVKNATLYYVVDNGTIWSEVKMNYNATIRLHQAVIPGQDAGLRVRFRLMAFDFAGNSFISSEPESYFTYAVVSEFPLFLFLPLAMTATLLAAIVARALGKKKLNS